MQIVTIVGARPQFIKAAMISHAIATYNACHTDQIHERILHTGQHFDANMSEQFFQELHIPHPTWNLGCTGNVAEMQQAIVATIQHETVDYIVVYGDTNSTLAGALAAEQLQIPLIHIEAGLRSYNRQMREEYNRIETDKRSTLLFCPTHTAVENLRKENITQDVYHVGDVMYDAALHYKTLAAQQTDIITRLHLQPKSFYLVTIHRAETTDDCTKLQAIFHAFVQIATADCPIVFPIHPRTQHTIHAHPELEELLAKNKHIHLLDPIGYLDMVQLETNAISILTDSGGVQKEAYFHQTPCITLREETEWEETVQAGWNILVGTSTQQIIAAMQHRFKQQPIHEYGTGQAATQIIHIISQQ